MALLLKRDYLPFPQSLDPLTPTFERGLIPVGISAFLSLVSSFGLLIFITHRLASWRKHYKEYVGYNQYVILIYNLLLADLQQGLGFVVSFHWLRVNKIVAPTGACFFQGWFIHLGDVSSGFFVLAIAVHTWLGVVKGYKIKYGMFVAGILGIWAVSIVLTAIGPIIHQNDFFTRAGGWVSATMHLTAHSTNHFYSAGLTKDTKLSASGSTTSGSSSSNSVPLQSTPTSFSTSAAE